MDYVTSRADETNVNSWREALMVCPTNGTAFAQMTAHDLRQNPNLGSPDAVRAEWASRQAVKFAPFRKLLIRTLDFVHGMTHAVPTLVAITAE